MPTNDYQPNGPRLTIDQAAAALGRRVTYHARHGPTEHGVITSVNRVLVFVLYDGDTGSKATAAGLLSLDPVLA